MNMEISEVPLATSVTITRWDAMNGTRKVRELGNNMGYRLKSQSLSP